MFNLACCLVKGEGCDADPVQAVQWLRRAVELGEPLAQAELARCYMYGDSGLPVSFRGAHRLGRLGADQGNAQAMSLLGLHFGRGCGVAVDDDEACKWWRQAAALGDYAATDNLCKLARSGHVPAIAGVRELGLGPL